MTMRYTFHALSVLMLTFASCHEALSMLILEKTAPAVVGAGGVMAYRISVTSSEGDATNLQVTDTLPANTRFLSARVLGEDPEGYNWQAALPAPFAQGGTVTFTRTIDLPEAVVANFEILVQTNSNTAIDAVVQNTVTASATGFTTVTDSTTTAVTVSNAISQFCPSTIDYQVQARNNNDVPVPNGIIEIQLPSNARFVSASAPNATIVEQPEVGAEGGLLIVRADFESNGIRTVTVRINPISPDNAAYAFHGFTNLQVPVGPELFLTSIAPFSLLTVVPQGPETSPVTRQIIEKYCCNSIN